MAAISIPVGTQPFLKSAERPQCRTAGEAIGVVVPIYRKSSDSKYYVADCDLTDSETSVVVGLSVTKAETDSQVLYVSSNGTVVDINVALTDGDDLFLTGAGTIGPYSDIPVSDAVVRVGYVNEEGDLVMDIRVTGTVKD